VITHLDDSEEEEDKTECEGGYTISPAIFSALNKSLGIDSRPLDIPETSSAANSPSRALILFQPQHQFFSTGDKSVGNEVDKGTNTDDPMDVEML